MLGRHELKMHFLSGTLVFSALESFAAHALAQSVESPTPIRQASDQSRKTAQPKTEPKGAAPPGVAVMGVVQQNDDHWTYTVNQDENLGYIASRLYGTVKYVPRIVEWNSLPSANAVQAGQVLTLREKPLASGTQAQQQLLLQQMAHTFGLEAGWADRFYTDRAQAERMRAERAARLAREKEAMRIGGTRTDPKRRTREERALDAALDLHTDAELAKEGAALFDRKEWNTALLFLRAARTKNPRHFQAWLQESLILRRCAHPSNQTRQKKELDTSPLDPVAREQISKLVGAQKQESCAVQRMKNPVSLLNTIFVHSSAALLSEAGKCAEAVVFAHEGRRRAPEEVKPWIIEINCLKDLGQKPAAQSVAREFVSRHPGMAQLPFLKIE